MRKEIEKQFDRIGEGLDAACDAVDCDLSEYIEGLQLIRNRLDVSIQAAKESQE